MKNKGSIILLVFLVSWLISSCQPIVATSKLPEVPKEFDSERAYQDVINQIQFGPRVPGSLAHQSAVEYIQNELTKAGWQVEIQNTTYQNHPVENILAKRDNSKNPIIIGAHYDSRLVADQDSNPSLRSQPVPGANDGASGVAVLLEIARVLPENEQNIWLVCFDSEDQGQIQGWDWLLGSTVFVDSLTITPQAAIIIDMIGDADLNIYREKSSNKTLTDQIWQTADGLGYANQFVNEDKYSMLDDHTPFLNKGIPAIDIIDFDYPYWHTTSDTSDKVSAASLEIVGKTLLTWMANNP
ncbi:MAG: M28 family peptidase [Anaerolineaceae bacterium]